MRTTICTIIALISISCEMSAKNDPELIADSGNTNIKEEAKVNVQTFLNMALKAWGYRIETLNDGKAFELDKATELRWVLPGEFENIDRPLKRKELVIITSRALKEADENNYTRFETFVKNEKDLSETLKRHLLRLYAKGIVELRPDGTFAGEDDANAQECRDILLKAMDYSVRRGREPEIIKMQDFEFPWQNCDDPSQWEVYSKWRVGNPIFSLSKDIKAEGKGGTRVDYTVESKNWNCVAISPKIETPIDLSKYDGITFKIYNPDPWDKKLDMEFRDDVLNMGLKFRKATGYPDNICNGPSWTDFKYYFDRVNGSRPYPRRDEVLKNFSKILFKVQDARTNGPAGFIVLDDFRLFNIERKNSAIAQKPSASATVPRADKNDLDDIRKMIEKKDYSGALCKVFNVLDQVPKDKDLTELARKAYSGLSRKEDRISAKEYLFNKYYSSICDDKQKAFAYRDLHQELANISSDTIPPFSHVLACVTIDPKYKFTDKDSLTETAETMSRLGLDTIKASFREESYDFKSNPKPRDLLECATSPVYKNIFALPFRNYVMWTYAVNNKEWWQKGVIDEKGRQEEYRQIYDLAVHLLKTYNGTGKNFLLGVWESDFHLLGMDPSPAEPLQTRINGFIEWMNIRQKAVEDARNSTPHKDVSVWHYAEVVRYYDGLDGKNRVVNAVLPYIKIDYVSYSSYESTDWAILKVGMDLKESAEKSFKYIEGNTPPADIPGRRLFIGEYGYPRNHCASAEEQSELTAKFAKICLDYGIPMICYWTFYCNEGNPEKGTFAGFWMINNKNEKQPVYFLHEAYSKKAKEYTDAFQSKNKRLPTQQEFNAEAVKWLE